jgi:hypothetical protein
LAEGLIVRSEGARTYERGSPEHWWRQLHGLIEAGTNLSVTPIVKIIGHSGTGAGAVAGTVEEKAKLSKKKSAMKTELAVDA